MPSVPWNYALYLLLVLISTSVTTFLAAYAWDQRTIPGASAFVWLMVGVTLWSLSIGLMTLSSTEGAAYFWARFRFVGMDIVPVAFLGFVLKYLGHGRWLTRRAQACLALIPLTTQLIVWTNDLHHLFIEGYRFVQVGQFTILTEWRPGPWFWVHTAYQYAVMGVVVFIIVLSIVRQSPPYRRQALWLLVGLLPAWTVNLIHILIPQSASRMNYMPFGFSLMGLAFAWALFRHRLLDLVPIARHTMVESMADGMIVLDGRDRIVDLNPAAEALLGRREETIGRSMSELLPSWEERVADLARDQELYSAISLTGDGTLRHYDLHVTPLRGQRLNQTGRLVVLHDVTERQGVEAALQQEIEAREELISDLDAFAHTTAHDLKAPLSFLTGYTFLLRERLEDEGNEEILAFVQSIDRTAFKMARIVDELLLLASVRQHEVTVAPLDMGAIVREVEERLEPAIAEAGAEVRKPETWPTALGHAPWVEEVWANYLSNAIKYGGVPPEVELGAEQDEENFVRFWVRDNGLGLTGEEQARLFAPYTRLQQVRAKGQGLGLSITRRIVEKLGGDVDVESEPGEGSTFSFRLPGGTSGEVVPRDDD